MFFKFSFQAFGTTMPKTCEIMHDGQHILA